MESGDGERVEVEAPYGVVLATGGFARRQDLRREYLPHTRTEWSLTQPEGDTGDALLVGRRIGAAVSLMGEACWIPTMIDPVSGTRTTALFELCKPYGINSGRPLYKRQVDDDAAWLILDWNHRRRYTLGSLGPGTDPVDALSNGNMFKAETVASLAGKIGIDADGLIRTVENWNRMCATGVDDEFSKGKSTYQLFVGDRSAQWSNMGAVARAPFYAIAVKPGDAGTKGGLLTDEHARVVDEKGAPIVGLYAAGNSSASVMGTTSLGAGVTLGPAMAFAYAAVLHMFGRITA
ncbi:3-oxosteroid 1-dehydrogenase (flavocytochrome c) [Colletotrichum kahawae]|uniref:3-oxosteroid 1-dehydrogenase (Flavocytochrome c) n=1 Tax=Colletotrichum kahawae TaxID=34407 RepID=A0AAD9XVJ4_COLKA|nr:3-oxosteroid 1-dehydrogenase (flavocytochrome c) [Colletotrichum kahawae]